jgi:hypothetical protein
MKDDLKPVSVGDGIVVFPRRPHPRGLVFWRARMTGKAREAEEKLLEKIKRRTASGLAHALIRAHKYTAMEKEIAGGNGQWFDAEGRIAVRLAAANALLAAIGDCVDDGDLAKRLVMAAKEIETGCPPAQGGPVLVRFHGKRAWILLEVAIFKTAKRVARENAGRGIFTPLTQKSIADAIVASCMLRRGGNQIENPGETKWGESFDACGLGSLPWQ